jgi:transposase
LFLFSALAFSRWRLVRLATDQRASTTLALIAETLAAIGGVPARVLTDRMACLNGGVVAEVVVPTPDYVRLASHYGFAPDFCHANDPQSKGIVEHPCGYAKRDLAVGLLTEAATAGAAVNVRPGNTAAAARCAEVNAVPPGAEPLPITSSQMTHLWDGLCAAYRVLGFESITKGDNVFRDLVLAHHRADQQDRRGAGLE